MSKKHHYKNESGRSILEMIGVLAIIGVLSVGGIAGYSKAMRAYKISKFSEEIGYIHVNIGHFFANANNFAGLTNELAIKTGIYEQSMLNTNNRATATSAIHEFGGEIKITPGTENKSYYIIEIYDMPDTICKEWLLNESSSSQTATWISVNGTEFKAPFSPFDIPAACNITNNDIHIGYSGRLGAE